MKRIISHYTFHITHFALKLFQVRAVVAQLEAWRKHRLVKTDHSDFLRCSDNPSENFKIVLGFPDSRINNKAIATICLASAISNTRNSRILLQEPGENFWRKPQMIGCGRRIINHHVDFAETIQGIKNHRVGVLVRGIVETFLPDILLDRPKILDVVLLENSAGVAP